MNGLRRWGSADRSGEPRSGRRRRFSLEPLEDRLLLSADPLLVAALSTDGPGGDEPVVVVLDMSGGPDAAEAASAPDANDSDAPSERAAADPSPRLVWPEGLVDDGSGSIEWTEVGDPTPSDATQESRAADPGAHSDGAALVLRIGTAGGASTAAPVDPDEAAPGAPPDESLARGPPSDEPSASSDVEDLPSDASSLEFAFPSGVLAARESKL